jgi:hypothetical protein
MDHVTLRQLAISMRWHAITAAEETAIPQPSLTQIKET